MNLLNNSVLMKAVLLHVGNMDFEFTYWEIGAMVFLVFLLILSFAHMRRHFVDWSVKGAFFGFFMGVIITVLIGGVLIAKGVKIDTKVLGAAANDILGTWKKRMPN